MGSTSQGKEMSLYREDCGQNEKFISVVRSLDKPQRICFKKIHISHYKDFSDISYAIHWGFETSEKWTYEFCRKCLWEIPSHYPPPPSLLCWTLVLRGVVPKRILRKRIRLRNTIASCYRWSNVHLHIL